jgi:hypothetical protein
VVPVLVAARDRRDGGEVETGVDAGDGGSNALLLAYVGFHDLRPTGQLRSYPCGEIVEHPNSAFVSPDRVTQMRADEAASAGHKKSLHGALPEP